MVLMEVNNLNPSRDRAKTSEKAVKKTERCAALNAGHAAVLYLMNADKVTVTSNVTTVLIIKVIKYNAMTGTIKLKA